MKKRTASFFTASLLLIACAFGLNGSVISITTTTPYAGGGTGALQCIYSTSADASCTTQWRMRSLPSGTFGSWRAMGTIAGSITTGPSSMPYEVQFQPTSPHQIITTNPQGVRVYRNKTTVVTLHYQ